MSFGQKPMQWETVLIEDLQREGLPIRPFMTTSKSKAPLIEGLALAIERGDLAILPDEVLLNELLSYQLERLPGGGYRYNAPAGLHDDTVIATALAWYGVQHGGLRVRFCIEGYFAPLSCYIIRSM